MNNKSLAKKTQSWANKIKSYQKKAPDLFNQDVEKSASEFRIDHYFDILDRVELEKGLQVDYLYIQQRIGGGPEIIAYPEAKKEEYIKIINKINDNELDYNSGDSDSENIIHTFLNYDNDKEFVCTSEKAENIIKRVNRNDENMDFMQDELFDQKLGEINFAPQITINTDKVTVRLVFFTKWGGFIEAKYQVQKDFPHKIIERETKTLIDYNCGYVY